MMTMSSLQSLISVNHRSVRAVNLEEDLQDPHVLTGYTPGAHIIDALRRITVSLQQGPRSRAWSITGPYGSGKSSFAHLLCSLLAPKATPAQLAATKLLRVADPQLAETITRERRRLDIDRRGLILATVSAEREPIARALLRGLRRGAELHWSGPGRKPDIVHRLRSLGDDEIAPDLILDLFEELALTAPVLIVVDEFGKNLEYASHRNADGDLYLLQRFAERLSSRSTFVGGLLTLTHLAFEDYLVGSRETRRREWRKIHGRFDDVPFLANSVHSINLLTEALHFGGSPRQRKAVNDACTRAETGLRGVSGHTTLPGDIAPTAASTYPLHPSVAIALPTLAAQLAQHDRSLVTFLTSDAPHALPRFLERETFDDHAIPFFRAPELYDYFFEDGAATVLGGPEGELAREIRGRIEEAAGLEALEVRVLKTVGLFNLIGGAARLTANAGLIEEALVGPGRVAEQRRGIRAILDRLSDRSLLTFRDFAGEYRVWQGSDFDVFGQITAARDQLSAADQGDAQLLTVLDRGYPLRPEVARRHSQQQHVLRYFESRYATTTPSSDVAIRTADADGLITYVLADHAAPRALPATTTGGEPHVVVWSPHGAEVREAALDFAAAGAVLAKASELESDPVARREMRHRVAALQATLANGIDEAFSPTRTGVCLFTGGKRGPAYTRAELSRLISDLCDERYPDTPVIRNEMINRRELTSQGAKARRTLLERAFTHEHEPRLAIEGYGPERAMYEAALHHTGLHRDRGDGSWEFGPPPPDSPLSVVWSHLQQLLDAATDRPVAVDTIYAQLVAPPFGMKPGAIPLVLVAALQHRAEDIFLYQEGSFQPVVDPAHIERLLKTPERFALKRASMIGLRAAVFEQLRAALVADARPSGRRLRNATTLAVVRPLIAFATGLPEYSRKTRRISPTAQQVCAALLGAREPDELLFTSLPQACSLAPFPPDARETDDKSAREFVRRLRAALAELGAAHERLLAEIGDLLYAGFAVEGPRAALREDLRARSRRLLKQVIEPKMRSFLLAAADENLDDDDWLQAMAMSLTGKPPGAWADRDVALFEALVAERSRWFRRLELLWHEMRAISGGGFEARRVTITAPDGREHAELVSADSATQELVEDILIDALAKLEQRIGSRAQDALLGALAGRVLPDIPAKLEEGREPTRKANLS
jgi:hypothetical protein